MKMTTQMSPEATRGLQALVAADFKATKAPAPSDLVAWCQVQEHLAANNPRADAAQATLSKLGLTMIDAKLGGVPVIDVRPRGWDTADRRLIIYVHGGASTARVAPLPTPVALLRSPAHTLYLSRLHTCSCGELEDHPGRGALRLQ